MSGLISKQAILDRTVKKNSVWYAITDSEGNNLEDILNSIPSVENKRFDGMTNGEVLQAVFPNISVYEYGSTYSVNNEYNFNSTWWNAPYQKGGERMTDEEVIKEIENIRRFNYTLAPDEVFDRAISALSENKSEWIPVSERLPEKNRAVLTYVDTGASKTCCLAYWKGEGWEEWIGCRMLETEMEYKVLAWQYVNLPEPYKEGK